MSDLIISEQAKISVDTYGSGEAILFIHAGIADKRMWQEQINLLSNQYYIINIDLPGFGKSELLSTEINYTDVVKEVIEFYQLSSVTVIAASFGAKVAIDVCLIYPEKIKRMILVSPAVSGWEDSLEIQEYEQMEESTRNLQELVELNYDFWIKRNRQSQSINPEVKTLMFTMLLDNFAIDTQYVEEISVIDNSMQQLDKVQHSVLIINGEEDVTDFLSIGKLIHKEVLHSELIIISKAAHLPNIEYPNLFNHYITDFLREPFIR